MKEEVIISIIKQKNYLLPSYLLTNYHKLNLTEEEVLILSIMLNKQNKISYDVNAFTEEIDMEKYKIMSIISSLEEKKVISIELIKNQFGKKEEYINLDLLYGKIMSIYLNVNKEIKEDTNLYAIFENELGRTLSPMEYEIIKGWTMDNFSSELITLALKEAVYNGVSNLRYIDKVLYEWRKKNIKTKEDIIKDKERYHKNKKEKVEVFDYNWLDE